MFFLCCHRRTLYHHFVNISDEGWHLDSCCQYYIPQLDSPMLYSYYLTLRHSSNYPYQNLWLEVSYIDTSHIISKDTIEIYLASTRGRWLGESRGSVIEMPVILKSEGRFHSVSDRIVIRHLMRDTFLYGLYDIGLRIEKVN